MVKKVTFKSISTRMAMFFLLAITILIVVSNLVVYILFKNIMTTRIMNDQEYVIYHNKLNIENLLNGVNQATVFLYTDKIIANALNKKNPDRLERISDIYDINEQFRNYMNAPLNSRISVYQATLYIFNEFPLADGLSSLEPQYATYPINNVLNDQAVSGQDWFQKTLKLNGMINTFTFKENKRRIYISRLIRNQNVKSPHNIDDIGVVVVSFDIEDIGSLVEFSELTKSTQILLANDDGQIVYCNNTGYINENVSEHPIISNIPEVLEIKQPQTLSTATDNNKYYVDVYPMQWKWKLMSIIPYKDIEDEISGVRRIIVFSSFAAIMAAIIFTFLISRNITKPIKNLAYTMRGVRDEGSIDICVEYDTNDEIGVLYSSFNKMMKRISRLMGDIYESGKKQRTAEIKALQAQINPHFIYNTLDSVGWLALSRKQDDIADMVSSLADVMRYSIKNPEEMVSLSLELTYIRNYVEIQKTRFKSTLNLNIEVDNELNDFKIPKFIIQPLVENAIIHGFKGESVNGTIKVSSRKDGNKILIDIVDNGVGTDVEVLNKYLNGEIQTLSSSDGFGIKNVNERIKLHFGEDCGIVYSLNEMKGVTARISLTI